MIKSCGLDTGLTFMTSFCLHIFYYFLKDCLYRWYSYLFTGTYERESVSSVYVAKFSAFHRQIIMKIMMSLVIINLSSHVQVLLILNIKKRATSFHSSDVF